MCVASAFIERIVQAVGVGGGLAFGIPLSFIVIARLRKAEAIQYKHLNHFINVFIRNNCQTGLLHSARNDGSGDRLDYFARSQGTIV